MVSYLNHWIAARQDVRNDKLRMQGSEFAFVAYFEDRMSIEELVSLARTSSVFKEKEQLTHFDKGILSAVIMMEKRGLI